MVIDGADREVVNDEAILSNGFCVGHITSGGYAHHTAQSVAMGYVSAALAGEGSSLHVEINGEMYPARVVSGALYDAKGANLRN
jgi:dimethylglycine dehydrogenase